MGKAIRKNELIKAALLLLFTVLIGCNHTPDSEPDNGPAPAKAKHSSADLYYRLIQFSRLGDSVELPAELRVEEILPYLHPWFNIGRGLLPISYDGHDGYLIKTIPNWVVQDLMMQTDNLNRGFLITSKSFWRRLSEKQSQGLKFGFLKHDQKFLVGGITYVDLNLIMFDVLASVGSLDHELRHVEQFAIHKRMPQVPSQTLSENCLSQAGHYFAELDATTYELPLWHNSLNDFDVTTALQVNGNPWHIDLDNIMAGTHPLYNLSNLIDCNLQYPSNAVKWLYEDHASSQCPQEIKDMALTIQRYTLDFERDVVFSIYQSNATWSRIIASAMKFKNKYKTSVDELPSEITNECRADADYIRQNLLGLKADLAKIDEKFDGAQQARLKFIDEQVNKLPKPFVKDLCLFATGFSGIYDCPDFLRDEIKNENH